MCRTMSPTVTRPGKRPQRGKLTSLQPNSRFGIIWVQLQSVLSQFQFGILVSADYCRLWSLAVLCT
jgi:hypothetical protein